MMVKKKCFGNWQVTCCKFLFISYCIQWKQVMMCRADLLSSKIGEFALWLVDTEISYKVWINLSISKHFLVFVLYLYSLNSHMKIEHPRENPCLLSVSRQRVRKFFSWSKADSHYDEETFSSSIEGEDKAIWSTWKGRNKMGIYYTQKPNYTNSNTLRWKWT